MKNKNTFQSTTYKYPFCCHPYADNIYEFIVVFDNKYSVLEKLEEVFAANFYKHAHHSFTYMTNPDKENWLTKGIQKKEDVEENLIAIIIDTDKHKAESSSIEKSLIKEIKQLWIQKEPDVESTAFLIAQENYVKLEDIQYVLDKILDVEKLKRFNSSNLNKFNSKEFSHINDLSIF